MLQTIRRNGFTFKQFSVTHDRCAMKITTDSILLGAWAPLLRDDKLMLDIGSGCGLLSLMLAQRTQGQCLIDAVEIDPQASQQALENVKTSPWATTISIINQDIRDYLSVTNKVYDLIICNPPYYAPGSACRTSQRDKARYTTELDHHALLNIVEQLISVQGRFCLVLPYTIALEFQNTAEQQGWFTGQSLLIRDNQMKADYLMLLELSVAKLTLQQQHKLTLRDDQGQYTDEFRQLTGSFYLNF